MNFSDSYKNPADWRNRAFNQDANVSPRPMEQQPSDLNQIIDDAKTQLGGFTEEHLQDDSTHDQYIDFVKEKLRAIDEDNCF